MSAVSDAIYNNYLTTYSPMSITKYDTHKKSELRDVYKSIVKMNKESPWFLPVTSKETQAFAVNIKEGARMLHNNIAQLGGLDENGLFDKKSAYSTDEDVAKVTYIGSDKAEEVDDFQLEVKNLASHQENLGEFLYSNEEVDLPPDTYSFDLSINDMNYEFQFAISEGETNRDVQGRLAKLINNSSIGIRASVIESGDRSSLKMTSDTEGLPAGKDAIFSVSDSRTSKASGTVDYFGLDYTSKAAANASFSINGEDKTASTNHFTIGKLFEVQLNGVSPEGEPVTIGLKTDIESLSDNINNLAAGYNEFLRAAASYLDTQSRSKALLSELNGIANRFGDSFSSLGLSIQDDGLIQVNSEKLKSTALSSEDVAQTFDTIKVFSNALLKKSDAVSLNPMEYVDKKVVAYKNPNGPNYASPYMTSAYSGMMFNGYC